MILCWNLDWSPIVICSLIVDCARMKDDVSDSGVFERKARKIVRDQQQIRLRPERGDEPRELFRSQREVEAWTTNIPADC
jgi:hypothetical protein